MRIGAKLIGCDDDWGESVVGFRISVHHGLDAAGLEDASRTARLPAQHEDNRQGRLAFRVGQCRRRQVDEGFACFKLRFRGRNVDFVDGSVRRNIADRAVGGLFAPLCDGDEVLAFGQSGQIGLAVGILAEQRADGGVFAVRLVDADRRGQYREYGQDGRGHAHHAPAQHDMHDGETSDGETSRHPSHHTGSQSDAEHHEHVGQQPSYHIADHSGHGRNADRQHGSQYASVPFRNGRANQQGYGQHCDDGERRRRKPASDQAYVHKPLTHISHPQHIGFPST